MSLRELDSTGDTGSILVLQSVAIRDEKAWLHGLKSWKAVMHWASIRIRAKMPPIEG